MRRTTLAATVLVFALAACGGESTSGSGGSIPASPAATTGATEVAYNDADVTFAQSMIPHHEQAIEMSELALDPKAAAGAKVKELAGRIKAAQDPEIAQMKAWLAARDEPLQMDTSGGHDMASMEGMMSAADMDALAAKNGKDFDASWVTMMIDHHRGAITMAETVKADGSDPAVLALADAIIAAQRAEIAEMQALSGA